MSATKIDAKFQVLVGGRLWLDKGRAKLPTRKGDERVLAEVAKKFGMTVGIRSRAMLNRLTEMYAHTIRDSMIRVITEQRGKNWPAYSKGYEARKLAAPRNAHGLTMLMFTGHLTRSLKVRGAGLGSGEENIKNYQLYFTGTSSNPLPQSGDVNPKRGRVWADRTGMPMKDLVERLAAGGRNFTEQGFNEGKREFQALMRSKNLTGLFYGQDLEFRPLNPTEGGGGE